ncbi:hypothetical protein BC831DRAFT_494186 [Entophlyctis helioformis]|nr:hypothetical protein BC831DRAFT_494186 [Entophlyctis helioformis]
MSPPAATIHHPHADDSESPISVTATFKATPSTTASQPSAVNAAKIVDVRGTAASSNTDANLLAAIRTGLLSRNVPFADPRIARAGGHPPQMLLRSIPTMVLYDDAGLDIFDKITYIDEYYLTDAEIDIFRSHAGEMVRNHVKDGAMLFELGCGSMRKTKFILEAIAASGKQVTYYAIDLSEASLRDSLQPLTSMFPSIAFVGLWGTYDDSLLWIKRNIPACVPKMYLWLGSSIGNLTREQAAGFLANVCANAMETGDLFICAIDRRNSFEALSRAYNDSHGLTRDFIMNGLSHVNHLFAKSSASNPPALFDVSNFEYVSIYNEVDGRHEAYYKVLRSHTVAAAEPAFSVDLVEGELLNVEYSYKYSAEEVAHLVEQARLYSVGKWTDSKEQYDLHLFQKPVFAISRVPATTAEAHAMATCPTLAQFEEIWKVWDHVSSSMIAKDSYLRQPIGLRHPYIFYIGHLPASWTAKSLTPPLHYADIFERGIDPNMDDPTICHAHSIVPDEWPALADILVYRDNVRNRVRSLYASMAASAEQPSKRMSRVLFMCYEHEAMHIETFLYMLMQDPHVQPPAGVAPPILRPSAHSPIAKAAFVAVPGGSYVAGITDREADDLDESLPPPDVLGWDNEGPAHAVNVPPFSIQDRPVTVGEYHAFLASQQWPTALLPASWESLADPTDGSASSVSAGSPRYAVKTAFGRVPLEMAWMWPVYVSHDMAAAYAAAHNARLPTEAEITYLRHTQASSLMENASFASWTPRDVRGGTGTVTDLDGNGWELTSTVFAPFDGFETSKLYPGYSSDFFDGRHNVLLGASWATPHRIASRKSFRNWYQRAYPYVFSKFRLAA